MLWPGGDWEEDTELERERELLCCSRLLISSSVAALPLPVTSHEDQFQLIERLGEVFKVEKKVLEIQGLDFDFLINTDLQYKSTIPA